MKLKARCNILYGGVMYSAGEVFEAKEALENAEKLIEDSADKPDVGEAENEKSEPVATEKSTKRR